MKHTPTPWELCETSEHHGPFIFDQNDCTICDLYFISPTTHEKVIHDNAEENAAHIVKCVNSHTALVEALKAQNDILSQTQRYITMYLEPGERRIVGDKELIEALLKLQDGPEQRKAQELSNKALSIAKGK